MAVIQTIQEFADEVQAFCDSEGIKPSYFTNQVLGQTYALPRMISKAEQIDSTMTRLRDAMHGGPARRRQMIPFAPTDGARRSLTFDLPAPPSTNKLFATVRRPSKGDATKMVNRRIESQSYDSWRNHAGGEVNMHRAGWAKKGLPMQQPYVARIRIAADDRADVDNRIKGLLDLMVMMQVTPDDRFLLAVSAGRSGLVLPGRVQITVRSIPLPQDSAVPRG